MADLVDSLEDICAMLCTPEVSAHAVASRFGAITDEYGGIGFSVPGWKNARIHCRSGTDIPNSLTLEPETPLPLPALEQRFGKREKGIAINPFSDPRWRFYSRPESKRGCVIVAEVPEGDDHARWLMIVPHTRL